MRYFVALRLAVAFLTNIPVGMFEAKDEDFGRAVGFFPLVGLCIGTLIAMLAWGLHGHLGVAAIATMIVAVSAGLTGGLHLDGVSDVFDGIGGGRGDRKRTLEIMRDSRIGSHGATALILIILGKFVASMELVAAENFLSLALAPLIARAIVVPIIIKVPYARSEGLGQSFQEHVGTVELLLAGSLLVAACLVGGTPIALATGIAVAGVACLGLLLFSKIRGVTGDGYGAMIELAEVLFLMGASAA